MPRYRIDSTVRMAAFLAQIGHESGQLRNLVESLNYSAERLMAVWSARFDAALAAQYARQPERIAAVVYNGHMRNTAPGDGWRYRGGGLIQVTGKTNYQNAGGRAGPRPGRTAGFARAAGTCRNFGGVVLVGQRPE
jgi:putative chitinase